MKNELILLLVCAGIGAAAYGIARNSAAKLGIPKAAVPAIGGLVMLAVHGLS